MYATTVNNRPLTFEVWGVWRRNMIIRDRETGSIWQHATGECIVGPLKGSVLQPVGGEMVRWGTWREEYSATQVAVEPEKPVIGLLPNEQMLKLFRITKWFATPGIMAKGDNRLPLHEMIIGIKIGKQSRAYPLTVLREQQIIHDTLGGEPVTISYDHTGDSVRAVIGTDDKSGVTIGISRQWWLGWSEFEPETDVYKIP